MEAQTLNCPNCGAAPAEATAASLSILKCPRCKVDMSSVKIGGAPVRECEKCAGLWVEALAFEKICTDREQQSALLGAAARSRILTWQAKPSRSAMRPALSAGN